MKENGGCEVKVNIESTQIEAHELFPIFFRSNRLLSNRNEYYRLFKNTIRLINLT